MRLKNRFLQHELEIYAKDVVVNLDALTVLMGQIDQDMWNDT